MLKTMIDKNSSSTTQPDSFVNEAIKILKKPFSKSKRIYIEKHKSTKRNYIKFDDDKLNFLIQKYQENNYPSKEEMKQYSIEFHEKFSKIENWFKHKRRTDVKKGVMSFSKKKVFTNEEIFNLMQEFLKCKKPGFQKYKELANQFNCEIKHIKNWFSYRRKLLIKVEKGKFLNNGFTVQANKIKEKCDEIFNEKKKNLQKKKFTDIEKNVVVAGEGIENNIKSIKKEEINKLDLDSTEKINNEESNKIKNFNNPLFSNIFGNNDFIINNNLFQNYSLNPYQNYPLSNFGNNMVFYNNMQTSFMNDFIFKQLHYTHLRQMMRGIGNIKKEI